MSIVRAVDSELKANADELVGSVLADRYRIDRKIGEGGMGAVYAGEHVLIGRRVALKFLHPQMAKSQEVVARFQREAMAATRIGNAHIIDVLDLGRDPSGAVYMVLEFLDGSDWADAIDAEGAQDVERVLHIADQLCEALEAAHQQGIIHRDLKPENVFLIERDGDPNFVKLLDFGIAKLAGTGVDSMTRTGMALGTPYYMAPEQLLAAKDVDARADIYSFGVMLFRALTGEFPFDADSYPLLVMRITKDPPPPVRSFRPELTSEFEAYLGSLMAKDPAGRPSSMREVREALASFRGRASVKQAPKTSGFEATMALGAAELADASESHPSALASDTLRPVEARAADSAPSSSTALAGGPGAGSAPLDEATADEATADEPTAGEATADTTPIGESTAYESTAHQSSASESTAYDAAAESSAGSGPDAGELDSATPFPKTLLLGFAGVLVLVLFLWVAFGRPADSRGHDGTPPRQGAPPAERHETMEQAPAEPEIAVRFELPAGATLLLDDRVAAARASVRPGRHRIEILQGQETLALAERFLLHEPEQLVTLAMLGDAARGEEDEEAAPPSPSEMRGANRSEAPQMSAMRDAPGTRDTSAPMEPAPMELAPMEPAPMEPAPMEQRETSGDPPSMMSPDIERGLDTLL